MRSGRAAPDPARSRDLGAAHASGRGLRVLLVEDRDSDALLVREYLSEEREATFELVWVERLGDALERLEEGAEAFDVALLDLTLPDSRGLATFEALREHPVAPPIVIYSNLADRDLALEAVGRGAQDYLFKAQMDGKALPRTLRHAAERGRLERELAHRERRFRALIERSRDVTMLLDRRGVVEFASPAASRVLGVDVHEQIGRPVGSALHGDDLASAVAAFRRVRRDGVAHAELVVRVRHADGSWRRIEASLSNALDDPAVGAVIVNYRDVTEQRRVAERLRMLEAAVEHADDTVIITEAEPVDSPGPRITYVNPAFTRNTGYEAEEAVGRAPRFLQGEATERVELDRIRRALESWQPVRVELANYTKDGELRWIDLNITPVKRGDGIYTHWVSVQRDVTERRAALERIEALNEDLERALLNYRELADFAATIETVRDADALIEEGIRRLLDLLELDFGVYSSVDEGAWRNLRVVGDVPAEVAVLLSEPAEPSPVLARLGATRATLRVPRYRDWPHRSASWCEAGVRSVFAIPAFGRDAQLASAVALVSSRRDVELEPGALRIAEAFVHRLENALEQRRRLEELRDTREATFRALGVALEYRDYETKGHTDRVVALSLAFAEALGLDGDTRQALEWGAYLHDVGKVGISDSILLKPGELDDEEWAEMKRHTVYGDEMMRDIVFLPEPTRAVIRNHHERWDGSGYPDGLSAEEIPLPARIFQLVDVYDALTSERPYKDAWPRAEAIAEIRKGAGTQFDPDLAEAFVAMLEGRPDL